MNAIPSIFLTAIFFVLSPVIYQTLKSSSMFESGVSFVLAICVSALCVMGLSHFLAGSLEVILLPYAALAVSLLLLGLLMFIIGAIKKYREYFFRDSYRGEPERPLKKSERVVKKRKGARTATGHDRQHGKGE